MSQHDPFDIPKQEAAQADADKKAKDRAAREINDLAWLMNDRRGRRIAYALLEHGGVVGQLESFFNMNALKMAYNEGMAHVGRVFHNKLTAHCFDQFMLMLKENTNE